MVLLVLVHGMVPVWISLRLNHLCSSFAILSVLHTTSFCTHSQLSERVEESFASDILLVLFSSAQVLVRLTEPRVSSTLNDAA